MTRRTRNRLESTLVPPAPVLIGIGQVVPPDPQCREVIQRKPHGDSQTGLHGPSHLTRLELLQKEHALLSCRHLKKVRLKCCRIVNSTLYTPLIYNRFEPRQSNESDPGERKYHIDTM